MSTPKHLPRTKRLYVRFTADELARATTRARAAGRPMAVYLRETALRGTPKARAGSQIDDVVHQIARMATALQDLSRAPLEATDHDVAIHAGAITTVLSEATRVLQRAAELMERGA